MKVAVKLFCGVQLASGRDIGAVELPEGATVAQLFNALRQEVDEAAMAMLAGSVVMVNQSKASLETTLKDGDEVLVLHPLGGG